MPRLRRLHAVLQHPKLNGRRPQCLSVAASRSGVRVVEFNSYSNTVATTSTVYSCTYYLGTCTGTR